jgi:hypothetical protein
MRPQLTYLREQAECCRHLARDSTNSHLCGHLLGLADEYDARADALQNDEAVDRAVTGDDSMP